MADIKTKDVVKGTIKKIDKAAIAADRMRSAYVQTKEKAEHATHPDEHNAEEYASDRVEGGVDRITHEAAHQFDKQGRKGLEETKRNVSKAKDGVQRFREKRAAESMKRQTVRTCFFTESTPEKCYDISTQQKGERNPWKTTVATTTVTALIWSVRMWHIYALCCGIGYRCVFFA